MDAAQYLDLVRQSMEPDEAEMTSLARQMERWGELRAQQLGDQEVAGMYAELGKRSASQVQTEFVNREILPHLVRAVPDEHRHRLERTPLGVLPLRTVNACAARAPGGEPVLILDSGLFSMCHFYLETQVVAYAIHKAQGLEAASAHHERAYRFILRYYEGAGQMPFPEPDASIEIPVGHLAIASIKSLAIETFVLAHEIGHLVAGHLDDDAPTESVARREGSAASIDAIQKSWQQEFQADTVGLLLYREACGSIPALAALREPLRGVAPFEFFQLAALVETNLDAPERYATHPPSRDRLKNLLGQLMRFKVDEKTFAMAADLAKIALTMPKLDRLSRD